MLANFIKKNLNIIFWNINFINFINYFIISDFYIYLYLKHSKNILNFFKFLKYSSFFNLHLLMDIKCEDICYSSNKYRYKLTYVFLSLYYNMRVFVTIFLKEYENIDSISDIFSSAEFLEREIWDEYGIRFNLKNRNINRRLLTDYGFKGHPLKKNYPLTGFYECVYYYEKARIKNIPINLLQEYRKFNLRSIDLN